MKVNKNILDIIKRNETKFKNESITENELLQKEFYTSYKNYEKILENRTSYEIALWIESNEKHIVALKAKNILKYDAGDIVLLDLGWNTYDREFCYIHPAIVIKNTYDKMFIVPCTSGKPRKNSAGKVFEEFEVGTVEDGFEKDTVAMLYEAKYVDKNRVISKLGKVTKKFYDKIYNKLFEQLFENKAYEIKVLENKIKNN